MAYSFCKKQSHKHHLDRIIHPDGPCRESMGGSRGETGGPDPPGKSQVAIAGFLRNAGADPLKKQLDPLREVRTTFCEIRQDL